MIVSIPCETFVRMSKVPLALKAAYDEHYYKSLFIEIRNKKLFFVSTNIKFAAIEYAGNIDQSNGFFNIAYNEALLIQATEEAKFSGVINVTYVEMLKFATAKTTFGYVHSENLAVFATQKPEFETWRNWLPDEIPTKPNGCINVTAHNLACLAAASPSGLIAFPQMVTTGKPVLVHDAHSPNWIGLFLDDGKTQGVRAVAIPTWVK